MSETNGPASTIELTLGTSGVETGVNMAKRTIASIGPVAVETGKALDSIGDAAISAGGKTDKAMQATQRTQKAWATQIQNSIIDLKAAGDEATRFELRAIGKGIAPDVYGPQVAQLRALKAEQMALAASSATASNSIAQTIVPRLNDMGMTARGTAAALRGVPAQLTDIVVSLQGGQAPLTVFLQQGGQLKDMFGGAAGAAKALGGYIVSLITPFSVVATAIAAVGIAAYKGAAETEAFNKALIMSGSASGATAAQLSSMASAIAASSNSTKGAAAEALTAFASSGNIAAASFEKFSALAIRMEKDAGQAISSTVEQFAALGKEPVAASERLNEKVHYLTASVYEQIKALNDQGDSLGAARLAQDAYADALARRLPELERNLGVIERAWRGVIGAAKGAWDAMMNIGRASDPIEAVQKQIAALKADMGDGPNGFNGLEYARQKVALAGLQEQLKYHQHIADSNKDYTASQAASAKTLEATISFDKIKDQFLSKAAKTNREITQATVEGIAAGKSMAEIETVIAGIREKNKEAAGRKPHAESDPYAGILNSINKANESALEQLDTGMKISASEKFRINTLNDIDTILKKHNKTLAEANELRAKALATAKVMREYEIGVGATSAAKAGIAYQKKQDEEDIRQINKVRGFETSGENQVSAITTVTQGLGLTPTEQKKLTEFRKIDIALAQAQKNATSETSDELVRLAAVMRTDVGAAIDAQLAKQKDLNASWEFGAKTAMTEYLDKVKDVAGQTKDLMTGAFKGMEDALTNFVMAGKLDFESLVKSVISGMVRMQAQQSIMKPLTQGYEAGGFSGALSAVFGLASANGNAFDRSGVHAFANGGTFTNQIVDKPTMFKFANGTGLMGEAGPEAIMPLTRGRDGKLGVQTSGENQRPIVVNQNFTVGDVASISMVKQAVANSQRQIAAALGRNATYGSGAMA